MSVGEIAVDEMTYCTKISNLINVDPLSKSQKSAVDQIKLFRLRNNFSMKLVLFKKEKHLFSVIYLSTSNIPNFVVIILLYYLKNKAFKKFFQSFLFVVKKLSYAVL